MSKDTTTGLRDSYTVVKTLSKAYEEAFQSAVPELVSKNKFQIKNYEKKITKLGAAFQSSMDYYFEKALYDRTK
jgi:hypothetical protein